MCLIIDNRDAKPQDYSTLYDACCGNPDGMGVVWCDTGEIEFAFSDREQDALIDRLEGAKRPWVAHFRFATHGSTDKANCHPYISPCGRWAVMMNGTVSVRESKELSDTAVVVQALAHVKTDCVESVLAYLMLWDSVRWFAFDLHTRQGYRLGDWYQCEDTGAWHSQNYSCLRPYAKPKTVVRGYAGTSSGGAVIKGKGWKKAKKAKKAKHDTGNIIRPNWSGSLWSQALEQGDDAGDMPDSVRYDQWLWDREQEAIAAYDEEIEPQVGEYADLNDEDIDMLMGDEDTDMLMGGE